MGRKHTKAAVRAVVRRFHRLRIKGPSPLSLDESADWTRWSADDISSNSVAQNSAGRSGVLRVVKRPNREEFAGGEYASSVSVRDCPARGNAKKRRS
jgi:hypothetical protein